MVPLSEAIIDDWWAEEREGEGGKSMLSDCDDLEARSKGA
jgi:hypothetical protein